MYDGPDGAETERTLERIVLRLLDNDADSTIIRAWLGQFPDDRLTSTRCRTVLAHAILRMSERTTVYAPQSLDHLQRQMEKLLDGQATINATIAEIREYIAQAPQPKVGANRRSTAVPVQSTPILLDADVLLNLLDF